MPRILRVSMSLMIMTLLVGGPIAYSSYTNSRIRNLHTVKSGVLYRSGQLTLAGLKQVIHEHGIKTVITLRDASDPSELPPDWNEEQFCNSQELNYIRISPRNWWSPDGSVPAEKGVSRFRAIMDDPRNYPVLIHCFAGIHRTGAYCAVYRMDFDRWTNEAAIAEMRAHGYRTIDDDWDLLEYLENYRPRWQRELQVKKHEDPDF